MIRYFLWLNKLRYQLDRIKDKLKELIDYQLKKDTSLKELSIFDTTNGKEVENLIALMNNGGIYVFGVVKMFLRFMSNMSRRRK